MSYNWNSWLQLAWPHLLQGQWVSVPSWLPHPAYAGFAATDMAEPHGQIADWVVACADGSRVHVHEHADGRLVAHRDPTDPARGPLHALFHWLFESTSGRVALGVGAAILIGTAVGRGR